MKRIKQFFGMFMSCVLILTMMPWCVAPVNGAALQAETASFISRSDGVWLWPLPQSAYNAFSDWAGCNGNSSCMFHPGNNHGGCIPSHATSNGYGHNGIDVGVVVGTQVYSAANGTLYCTSTDWGSRGITAIVEHPIKGTQWSYYSVYQHLNSVVITKDQKTVSAGEIIAYSGMTDGYGTGAPHLHFGILLAKSGQGYAMSRNPNSAVSTIENKGWVQAAGYVEGRIMNNPAINSPAGYPTGASAVVPNLKSHAGSVMYTFNKNEVNIGESNYLSKCTSYPSYCLIAVSSNKTYVKSLPCSENTDSESVNVEIGYQGDLYTAIGLYKNTAGNLWYKVQAHAGGEGYIYAGDADFLNGEISDVTLTGVAAPTVVKQGSAFDIKGVITAKYQRLSAVGAVVYQGTALKTGKAISVDTTNYSLSGSELDHAAKFDELSVGSYDYEIFVEVTSHYAIDATNVGTKSIAALMYKCTFTVENTSCSHTFNGVVTQQASCTSTGIKTYTCSKCGNSYTESIAKKSHTYVNGCCSVCGSQDPNYTGKKVIYYDTAGSVWETGYCDAGAAYTVPITYPLSNGEYFSGWAYEQGAEVFDVRPGDTITVTENIDLYPVYISHADAISGQPVLIYNIEDFTETGYKITERDYEITRQETTGYWTDWSSYSTTKVTASDTVEVKTAAMYRYYYYLCSSCGDHNPLAGGCGCGGYSNDFRYKWFTTPYSQSSYQTVSYATSKCVTTALGDGQQWYFSSGNKNHTAIGTVDSDSSSVVITTGYSSRSYVSQTQTTTQTVTAYVITVNNHGYIYSVETRPTATQAGSLMGICYDCHQLITITLPALNSTDYTYAVETAATCDADGTATYTYTAPADRTVYFDNTIDQWAEVYVYTWSDDGEYSGSWPGVAMSPLGGGLFAYNVPDGADYIIFNNHDNGIQTEDLTIPSDGKNLFDGYGWSIFDAYRSFRFDVTLPKTGHSYSYAVTKDPTTSATGTLTGTCSKCKGTTTVTLPKLNTTDYTYSVKTAATCTADGTGTYTWKTTTYGSFIFNVLLPKTGHSYSNGVCTRCGEKDPDSVVDANAPQLVLDSKTASKGTTVSVDLKVMNNPGFSVLNVAFLYDREYLTLTSVENKASSMVMTHNTSVLWDSASNYTEDGVLATLNFAVAENAPEGAYEIQVVFMGASNEDFEEVKMAGVSGVLTVTSVVYGDANGDGQVTTVDLAMLRKYLSGMDPITGISSVNVKAGADCNGDGTVNTVDLAMLRKYLAGMDPITGESSVVLGPK